MALRSYVILPPVTSLMVPLATLFAFIILPLLVSAFVLQNVPVLSSVYSTLSLGIPLLTSLTHSSLLQNDFLPVTPSFPDYLV